jgi:exodeoxyribonuclease V beta subunit
MAWRDFVNGRHMSDLLPFDITASLPEGPTTTLLEASAGTGKTWTIGALVTRYVAEGRARLEQLLVVTFGRMASRELRERVRLQLVDAERALADPDAHRGEDALIDLLLDADEAELDRRHRRVRAALASYDAATIATTHQFCAEVLGSLGVAGDSDSRAELVEDLDEVLTEVVDDLYLRKFAYLEEAEFSRSEALAIARAAAEDPRARIEPADQPPDTPAGMRVAFAEAVRAELNRRKRRLGVLSYDDLLSQVADALDENDAPARARMRQRWTYVLVDEFQDTDPVQWQVLDRAFSGFATMVLIGDPKQAIYAFRGGDVVSYLQAADTAADRRTLSVNRRSDQALVTALDVLLGGAELGDSAIVVRPVEAHHQETRLTGAPVDAPVRLRVVRREQLRQHGARPLSVAAVRPHIARDLACDVRALLASGATFEGRPLEPRDVAVIASRHADLDAARSALADVGIPAVIAGGGSVFATPAAVEWLAVLEALEQPHRTARVRAAALTSLVGVSARELDEGGDAFTDELAELLRDWSAVLSLRGVAAVLEAATERGLGARLLAQVGGERQLTDLAHICEVLHEVGLREALGAIGLLGWLRRQIADARDNRGIERTRRLDSDAAAVQLVTIHASKGLEYPVVYLPTLADQWEGDPRQPLYHDEDGHRCRDVAGSGPAWGDHVQRWRDEERGERLRLLYVAMTRAKSQVVTWWAPSRNAVASPLQRLLLGRGPAAPDVPPTVSNPTDDEAAETFARWAAAGGLVVEAAEPASSAPPRLPVDDASLSVRTFDREVDTAWRRTSYSALAAHDEPAEPLAGVTSEPENPPRDDEVLTVVADPSATHPDATEERSSPASVVSPMAELPVGATFGSLVHAVLEHTDPDAPAYDGDLRAEIAAHVAEQQVWWPVPGLDTDVLTDALVAVCDSPLGSLAADHTLRSIPRGDRLCELDFELPLAGGDLSGYAADRVRLGQVADLLRRHLPPGDPVLPYAEQLDRPGLGGQELLGYLTGSVDVVLRVDGRFLVVDYKTNWLGVLPAGHDDATLTSDDYTPARLDVAMGHSDYPLQALLYAVVLHRFLRWRVSDYDPELHLGGVLYLYLRGMCGPDTPRADGRPCGVFQWRPPSALVTELSDLLDGLVVAGD